MRLSGEDYTTVEELTDVLYELLPATFNNSTSFPIAARLAGVGDLWKQEPKQSKRPAIRRFLTRVVLEKRERIPSLMLCVIEQSKRWRTNKGNPLTRREVDRVNELVEKLGYRVKKLRDPVFLSSLSDASASSDPTDAPAAALKPSNASLLRLQADFLALSDLSPQQRGYEFEKWLAALFGEYQLAPRSSFRLVGEQIDGSFDFQGHPYLLEAKWQNDMVGVQDLLAFSGKVGGKAVWTRGLFVSYCGFSPDGLEAFSRGRQTNLVAMEGRDLAEAFDRSVPFTDLLIRKLRKASESNRAFVPFRELYRS